MINGMQVHEYGQQKYNTIQMQKLREMYDKRMAESGEHRCCSMSLLNVVLEWILRADSKQTDAIRNTP